MNGARSNSASGPGTVTNAVARAGHAAVTVTAPATQAVTVTIRGTGMSRRLGACDLDSELATQVSMVGGYATTTVTRTRPWHLFFPADRDHHSL